MDFEILVTQCRKVTKVNSQLMAREHCLLLMVFFMLCIVLHRMWEFSVALYMIRIWPDSLLFAAIYGVVETSSVVVFGPVVGTLVERATYLQVTNSQSFANQFCLFVNKIDLIHTIILETVASHDTLLCN